MTFHPARADTVWLDNGDRLSGTIQSLDNGILLLKTAYGGDIRIEFKQVKTLQSATSLVVNDQVLAREYDAKLLRAQAREVVLEGVQRDGNAARAVTAAIPLDNVERITRPHPILRDASLYGTLDLSLNQKHASTNTQDYAVKLRAESRHGLWRHRTSGAYARSKEAGNVNTNNYAASYTLDRFLTQQAFWQGRVSHRQDWVEEVRRQTAYGTGPGYQFWDDELGAFSLSVLLGGVYYGYDDGTSQHSPAAALRWDYKRYISGKAFEIYTQGEAMRPFSGGADFNISGEVGLRYNINHWMSLYIKYARDQVSGSRQTLNESVYGAGVGLSF